MELSTIERSSGLKDKMRRLGRGNASKGNYSGKWLKGQKARAWKWSKIPAYFEGWQTPLYMRLPKLKGFKRYYKLQEDVQIVNIWSLDSRFGNGDKITKELLAEKWLIRSVHGKVKILWNGTTSKKFVFEGIELLSSTAQSYTLTEKKSSKAVADIDAETSPDSNEE